MRRPFRRSLLLALPVCLAPVLVQADDLYPSIPDDQDHLCETIARTASDLVPPRDRAWFQETCTCSETRICGRAGSRRYAARLQAGPGELQAQKEAAARERAWRRSALQSAESLRQVYRACRATGTSCQAQMAALEEGCRLVGLLTWDECMARE
jgi:hypothetical protein